MIRILSMLFTMILIVTLITGCWSRRELNDIAIVVAIGVDKKGEQYQISTQIVNPSEVTSKKGAGGKGAAVATYVETGPTVFEAFRKMTSVSPRRLYFSHLRMLIIGEEVAKEGVGNTLDLISRDHEFRSDFYIAVTKGIKAEKILEVYTVPQEIIPANKMFKSLDNSSKHWAATGKKTLDQLLSDIIVKGKEPILTGVDLSGDLQNEAMETKENVNKIKPISSLRVSGLALFKKDKLVGWFNEEESKAYNYINGDVKNTVGHIPCPNGGLLTVEVIRSSSKMKGKVINGKPEVNVALRMEANVADVECKIDLTKAESIKEIETISENQLENLLSQVINKSQKKFKTDVFGLGSVIHRSNPKEWKKLRKNWDQDFVDVPVNVEVNVNIRRLGTITDSIKNIIRE